MNLVKLGDICDFFNGGAWTQSEFTETGYPVLKVSNCKNSGFEVDDVSFIPHEIAQRSENNKLHIGDVIIATVGSHPNLVESAAGRSCIVTKKVQGFYLNQNAVCLRSKDCDVLDQRYLGYLAASAPFKHYIQSRGKGAANQMRIAIGAIKEYEFEIPDIHVQRKIGATLDAYDDLIENNQEQIKLLEEAAQRLYTEWFVDLRFPGHETTPITDGIPEGWKKDRADAFFNMSIGKTPPRAEKQWFTDGGNGTPWISISDMGNYGTYVFDTAEALTVEAISKHNVKVVPSDTVLVSFKLTVGRVSITTTDTCTNEAIAHFLISNSMLREYTYLYLKCFEYDSLGNTSAISKAVNSKIIKGMPFVMPDNATITQFHKIAKPIFDAIKDKQSMNMKLAEARDRLLPKLMNGEIEV